MRDRRYSLTLGLVCLLVLATVGIATESYVLPPADLKETDQLSSRARVLVKDFRFEGNTAFSDAELIVLVQEFVDKKLTSEDLEQIRQVITRHYVRHGYVNSGAVLPDQNVHDGSVTYTIVEGALTETIVRGNKRLRSSPIVKQVKRSAGPPLNINALQQKLQVMKLNPTIKRINAELKPGVSPGQSYLDLLVEEANPFFLSLEVNNERTPSVGAERLVLNTGHRNVFGLSDVFGLTYGVTKGDIEEVDFAGLDDISGFYSLPLNSYGTTLTVSYGESDFAIIEEPFDDLNIESESEDFSIALSHPLYKTYNEELVLTISGDRRQTITTLDGSRFPFSVGSDNGLSRVAVVRFVQNWVKRSLRSVVAVRSSFNLGVDALNATMVRTTSRDAEFFSWLGQFQYVRRLGNTANQVIFKNVIQLTDDQLLSLEQFSIGGSDTVRGYRENQIVRDRGFISSIELRIPIAFDQKGREILQISPFYDYGRGTNAESTEFAIEDLSSIGIGILFTPNPHVDFQVYWGHTFKDVDNDTNDLQDKGIHFSFRITAF